jgi:hypothetical protein
VRLTAIGLLSLFMPISCSGAELFKSSRQKDAFLKALAQQDERYDPAEHMIRRPFSSPGYHTTLKGGYVHPPRDSLNYAVALLDSGEPDRLERAGKILRRVISLQDQNPNSRTYGIWSWFMEEPLEKMAPPDWNWADFCGAQLLQVVIDHMDRLPTDLQQQVRDSILHAGRAIKRRNVGPGYTNIAVMGAYVTLVAGELFDNAELADYGKARLKRFYDHTFANGSFSEYNSPTYSIVAIGELSRMSRHVRDAESQKLLRELNRFAWSSPSSSRPQTAGCNGCPIPTPSKASTPIASAPSVLRTYCIISPSCPSRVWRSRRSPETSPTGTTSSAPHTFILISR